MRKWLSGCLSLLMGMGLLGMNASSFGAANCYTGLILASGDFKLIDWRKSLTNPAGDGSFSHTDKAREEEIKDDVENLKETVLDEETTPFIHLHQSGKANLVDELEDDSSKAPRFRVSGLKESGGILRGTLLLPVSGHTGKANALKWAKTDTYDLVIESPSQGTQYLARNAKSQDVITAHEIELKLKKGEKVTLKYIRSGSLGPSGFHEGRVMEFVWDGN